MQFRTMQFRTKDNTYKALIDRRQDFFRLIGFAIKGLISGEGELNIQSEFSDVTITRRTAEAIKQALEDGDPING